MTELERENYCKNCNRSIYGESILKCDCNVENNGKYVGANDECQCKVKVSKCLI